MIKKVKHNVFDCFFGEGWVQWIRMRLNKGHWEFVTGDPQLTKGASIYLSRRIKA